MIFFRKKKEEIPVPGENALFELAKKTFDDETIQILPKMLECLWSLSSEYEKHTKTVKKYQQKFKNQNFSPEDLAKFQDNLLVLMPELEQLYLLFLFLNGKDVWQDFKEFLPSVIPDVFSRQEEQRRFAMDCAFWEYNDIQLSSCQYLIQQIIGFGQILSDVRTKKGYTSVFEKNEPDNMESIPRNAEEFQKYTLPLEILLTTVMRTKLLKSFSDLKNKNTSLFQLYEILSDALNYSDFKKYVIQFLKRYENIEEIFEIYRMPEDLSDVADFIKYPGRLTEDVPGVGRAGVFGIVSETYIPDERKTITEIRCPDYFANHEKFWNDYIKLCELAGNEFVISPISLNFFLIFEFHLEKFKQRGNTITRISNDSKNKSECIRQFLEEYPTNWINEISVLERIFHENSIEFTTVEDEVIRFQDAEKRENFKNSLLTGVPNYTLDDVDLLDGIKFEEFLSKLFTKMGYISEVTKASGDQGADLILSKRGKKIAVQAKRYSEKVTNSAIQEAVTALRHYDCDSAMVVTTNYFTKSAIELASSNSVKLTDRDDLAELLDEFPVPNPDFEL